MQGLKLNIEEFTKKIKSADLQNSAISQYSKDYIRKNHHSLNYSTSLALQILKTGVENCNKPISEITIAEIGGGTGIISLLAKFAGFGKVIYSDVYMQSCDDFKIISEKLKLLPDKIICGSINELQTATAENIDLIVSRDVIEHIYDFKHFFDQCNSFFKQTVHIHNTSANIYNIFKKKYFKKIHNSDEYIGYKNLLKPSDSELPFLQMRYYFIKENFNEIDDKIAMKIAKLARGKNYNDLKTDVKNYIENKTFALANSHPTNTCDPANGNRSENLLNFEEYEKMIDKSVFEIKWDFAKYDLNEKNPLVKLFKILLNILIKNFGEIAKYLSPAIILIYKPKV